MPSVQYQLWQIKRYRAADAASAAAEVVDAVSIIWTVQTNDIEIEERNLHTHTYNMHTRERALSLA